MINWIPSGSSQLSPGEKWSAPPRLPSPPLLSRGLHRDVVGKIRDPTLPVSQGTLSSPPGTFPSAGSEFCGLTSLNFAVFGTKNWQLPSGVSNRGEKKKPSCTGLSYPPKFIC